MKNIQTFEKILKNKNQKEVLKGGTQTWFFLNQILRVWLFDLKTSPRPPPCLFIPEIWKTPYWHSTSWNIFPVIEKALQQGLSKRPDLCICVALAIHSRKLNRESFTPPATSLDSHKTDACESLPSFPRIYGRSHVALWHGYMAWACCIISISHFPLGICSKHILGRHPNFSWAMMYAGLRWYQSRFKGLWFSLNPPGRITMKRRIWSGGTWQQGA